MLFSDRCFVSGVGCCFVTGVGCCFVTGVLLQVLDVVL